jgi:hypothetical protein
MMHLGSNASDGVYGAASAASGSTYGEISVAPPSSSYGALPVDPNYNVGKLEL